MPDPLARLTGIWREIEADPAFNHLRREELGGVAQRLVPGAGRIDKPPVAFIGEAPGRQEDEQGAPFIGQAGQLLFKHVIDVTGLHRDDVWTTNVVKYRPPNNRTPWGTELRAGARYLRWELGIVQPRVRVTLGGAPLSLLSPNPITMCHGQPFEMRGILYFPLFHPAYLLRRRDLIDVFRDDLRVLAELLYQKEDQS